ncbi:Rpn family recombination-promoting nuclease/putative transposase [Dorea sp.]
MRKTKEKQRNITNQGKAVADIKETDDRKQADFIMLPTVDFCFKEMMHNKNVRKGIIAAILNVHPDEVEDTQLLPTILRKESEDDKYYRRIAFCDTQTGKEYSDMMEIHLLELPKLPPEQQSETDLIQWMRFLSGKNREDLKRMAEKNSNLQEAYNELDRLSADKKKRLEYEARQKAIRDKNILLKTGKNRGIEKGERIGFEKGTQATLEKLILSMLKEQLPLDKISSITGESLEAIQTLGKKYGFL